MAPETSDGKRDPWAACTFEGARDETLRLGRRMTFREKVIWLEQAARLSMAFRVPRGTAGGTCPCPEKSDAGGGPGRRR